MKGSAGSCAPLLEKPPYSYLGLGLGVGACGFDAWAASGNAVTGSAAKVVMMGLVSFFSPVLEGSAAAAALPSHSSFDWLLRTKLLVCCHCEPLT